MTGGLGLVSIESGLAKCKSDGPRGERPDPVVSYGHVARVSSPGRQRAGRGSDLARLRSRPGAPPRAGFDVRREDAGGPVLPEPARSPDRGGGLDSLCSSECRPNRPADPLLVAPGAGRGEPPRQVPAPLSTTVAGAAVSGARGSGFGV